MPCSVATRHAATEFDEDGRLAVAGGHQLVVRALEADAREVVAEEVVGLLERAAGGREGLGQRPSHADLLRSLTREEQRDQGETSLPQRNGSIDLMPDSSYDRGMTRAPAEPG